MRCSDTALESIGRGFDSDSGGSDRDDAGSGGVITVRLAGRARERLQVAIHRGTFQDSSVGENRRGWRFTSAEGCGRLMRKKKLMMMMS